MASDISHPARRHYSWLEDLKDTNPEAYANYIRQRPQVIDSAKDYTDGKQRRKFPHQPRDPLGGP